MVKTLYFEHRYSFVSVFCYWTVFCFPAGVLARSFHQCFNLCSSVFNLQTATPGVRKHTLQHLQISVYSSIYHTQCAGCVKSVSFCLAGEAHRLFGCGWQHSPMGARVQRQTLRQPGQAGVYRWSDISLLSWLWVDKCISDISICVMFQGPAIRRCWSPTVREPWTISPTADPSHESCPTSFLIKVRVSAS